MKYLLTSSIYKKEDGFDLHCQLIEAESGNSKYANKWSEPLENAPTIVGNLADDILKTLKVSSKQNITKAYTANPDAYEFYLKAKHRYDKRENTDDTEIARGLLKKAIELDNNLIVAKTLLGWTYSEVGDYDMAMKIYSPVLKQAEELGDKLGMGISLGNIGSVYWHKGDYGKSLDYHNRALVIIEELGDKQGVGSNLFNIGFCHLNSGNTNKALNHFSRSLNIFKDIGAKRYIGVSLRNIGIIYYYNSDYKKAEKQIEKALAIQRENSFSVDHLLWSITYLSLSKKQQGKEYNKQVIYSLIKEAENINFEIYYRLSQILEDTFYLETAYNKVQEKAAVMEEELKAKFLSYPIPKAIVKEWEKVK